MSLVIKSFHMMFDVVNAFRNISMITYNFGPRSDENSQWNTMMLRFGSSATNLGVSVFEFTNSVKICSCV